MVASRYYYQRLVQMRDGLDASEKKQFDDFFFAKRKNQTHLFVTSQFVGDYGIDRMALGQPLIGILKLVTLGGLGIWTLVDYFLIGGSARLKNLRMAEAFIAQMRGASHD
ncbi:TM2 domain-containing protein [Parvularcula sp. IMCC14364]|uniref:TM2 domain-containing protein n=1 Tax=Parvularcula sp. IMCC14364 TaxID=3067902 RepID=UPI00274057F4|nr:TM2 domain-containing protein [Parvularcula sp. IMCC14364]